MLLVMIAAAQAAVATPVSPPPPPAPADWRSRPLAAGVWTWRGSAEASEALFSDATGVQLSIRCTRTNRQVRISRGGLPASVPIRIATTSSERVLPAGNALAAGDPLLDAIAFSRGRLWVAAVGISPLILRSAAEPARSIEDCRS